MKIFISLFCLLSFNAFADTIIEKPHFPQAGSYMGTDDANRDCFVVVKNYGADTLISSSLLGEDEMKMEMDQYRIFEGAPALFGKTNTIKGYLLVDSFGNIPSDFIVYKYSPSYQMEIAYSCANLETVLFPEDVY